MRLFLGLVPDAAARTELGRIGPPPPPWRPSDPATWHVTLVFLGEVERPEPVTQALREACAAHAPVPVRLGAAVRLGPALALQVHAGRELDRLQAACAAAARAVGVEVEHRPFRPHLTLARGRGPLPELHAGGVAWVADEAVLVRSHPPRLGGPSEHRHEPVAVLPLAGRPAA